MRYAVGLSLLAMALSGCATLSKEECLQGNWYVVGYNDAARGYDMARLSQHGEACAEYGVRPDLQNYQAGRQAGTVYACADSKAYKTQEVEIMQDRGDWYAIGADHGARGLLYEPARYRDNCAVYNIGMNLDGYLSGYQTGIRSYCSGDNGYRLGQAGNTYTYGVCGPYERDFLSGYVRGLDHAIREVERELDTARRDYNGLLEQYNRSKNEEERKRLNNSLNSGQDSVEKLRDQRAELVNLRAHAEGYRR